MLQKIDINLNQDYNPEARFFIKSGDWVNLMKKLNDIIDEINELQKDNFDPEEGLTDEEKRKQLLTKATKKVIKEYGNALRRLEK